MTASAGTREGFDREILPQLDLLYRVALRYTEEPSRAEDLVQDTMLKAFRAWQRYRQGTSARAWLLAILRNTFINSYRRSRREPESMETEALEAAAADQVFPDRRSRTIPRATYFSPDRR